MDNLNQHRRTKWTPPIRPDWVSRIVEEGKCMDIKSVVPLDEDSLVKTAQKNTGLTDFGADDWYEPFKVFIKALDEESNLHLMGRLMTRSDLLILLEQRLMIEDTYKRHPEIEQQEIVKPFLIMGQGRTGTSVLQNMLSADPNNGPLKTWEAMFPCPPPRKEAYLIDPRIEKCDRLMRQWNRVTPEVESIHEFNGEVPSESVTMQSLSFMNPGWLNLFGQAPSFNAYMADKNMEIAYAYEKRVLKLLQWKNSKGHWVLKTPIYILHMPQVLKIFPDACFIWTHRDPIKALSSVINTLGTLAWVRSDTPFIPGYYEDQTGSEAAAFMMSQPIDWIETGIIPRAQLCNVQYLDFVRSPIDVVRQIYDFFGIPMTEEGRLSMQRYMDERPRSQRPEHRYDTGHPELIAHERRLFKRYQDYFNVPNEV